MVVSVGGPNGEFKESPMLTSIANGESETKKEIVIKKAKFIDDFMLHVEYSEHIIQIDGMKRKDIGGTLKRDGENTVHDDLKKAFEKLNPHLGLLAEMIKTKVDNLEDLSPEIHRDFSVTGFTDSGDGVVLTGTKMLSRGKVLNITTPIERWEDSDYQYISELAEAIEACKYEAEEYLNGKMAPPQQQEMEFEKAESSEEPK